MQDEAAECLFCHIAPGRVIAQNDLAYAIRDGFPVTPLHTLVIPTRHVADYFGLDAAELLAIDRLLHQLRAEILAKDPEVTGFNVGMNVGAVAGQTIFHCHVHLIPRRAGDVKNPRGGVRHVIPGKGFYWRVADAVFSPRNPTLEDYWRGIMLLGRNVASYKFAQTKALAAK